MSERRWPPTDPELRGPQGPADWSQEVPADDRLSLEVWRRLLELAEDQQREP